MSCNLQNITIRLSTPPPRFRMYTSNIHLPPSVTLLIEFHEEEKSYPSYNAQTTVEFVNRVIHQFLDFWRYLLTLEWVKCKWSCDTQAWGWHRRWEWWREMHTEMSTSFFQRLGNEYLAESKFIAHCTKWYWKKWNDMEEWKKLFEPSKSMVDKQKEINPNIHHFSLG